MSRIAKVDVSEWDAELREITCAEKSSSLERGGLNILAHRPEIAKGFVRLWSALKKDQTLPDRMLELVRLRIAFHNQCRSCMAIRYRAALDDGLSENLVCSLEKPMEAPDLSAAEKAALAFADRFANDHLSIDEKVYEGLRVHFSEGQLVELGAFAAVCVGFGRLGATWDMVEELPSIYQDKSGGQWTT